MVKTKEERTIIIVMNNENIFSLICIEKRMIKLVDNFFLTFFFIEKWLSAHKSCMEVVHFYFGRTLEI